ncbi:hypothetical protein FFLO_02590 [Filobasidium floriforme]|uniref:Mitochondrial carrier n=1 Tax=Filobasidium floriforme TaxID=5210 RepID=A0A8K0NRN0_9TREE|nr:hypothetical protein FFLO_02590 [Filobasidium floriforme]
MSTSTITAEAKKAGEKLAGKVMPLTPTFGVKDYSTFFLAGALCCTITHGAMTPFQRLTARIQIDPKFSRTSMLSTGRQIIASEGPRGLLTGFGPTAVGYLVQGGAKFAGYEFWKKQLVEVVGSQEGAVEHRTAIYLVGASVAEFFADILLAPLEATRIRLVSDPKYATGLATGFAKLSAEEGFAGLYAGFLPLICKQIPYAIGQFTVNEFCHELALKGMDEHEKANLGGMKKLGIDLGSGITAGAAAAILSHPADSMLSAVNKGAGPKGPMYKRLIQVGGELGFSGLWAGLGPRIVMTAGLVTGQFLIYGWIKEALNAPPGVEIHKEEK